MKTKNIQDVVAEIAEKLHYELVALMEQPEAFQQAIHTTLTQLVKDVEAGEMDSFEEGRMFAYNEALDACNSNETSEQVADDIRQKIRRPDIYETKRTPPTSDVTEK